MRRFETLIQFIVTVLRPYKGYLWALGGTAIYYGFSQSLTPYLIKIVIDKLSSGAEMTIVYFYTSLYLIALASYATNFRLMEWIRLRFFPKVRVEITTTMYNYIRQHSYRYLQGQFSGSMANKISDMNTGIINSMRYSEEMVGVVLGVLIGIGFMALVSPIFSIILFVWGVSFVWVTYFFSKRIDKLSHYFSQSKTVLVGHIVDAMTNIVNVWLFARQRYESKRLDRDLETTVARDRALQWQLLKLSIIHDLLIMALVSGMFITLLILYQYDRVTLGDFTFILMLSVSIFQGMWWVARQMLQMAEEIGKCQQAMTLLSAPLELLESPEATELKVSKAEITFEKVYFYYNKNNPLFENMNLTIQQGEKVGLVGYSGSGKTTFTHLTLRFYDVTKGRILIDAQDIKKVTFESLRSNIVMIPQDTILFHRTLMENIRYGRPEATDEEVMVASVKAECHDFISQLPEGYQALVGERGVKLSGGQRQRIAIARAILKDAPILILDEATSALDSVTEKQIQTTLYGLMEGRTTIVIAHRLSTLYKMDRILVFDKGRIIESGTHAELLNKDGHYAHMWSLQAGGFLPEQQRT